MVSQVSTRYEEFAQHRLQTIKDKLAQLEEGEDRQLLIIGPLIKNYSLIFRESMKGQAQLKAITQKCYESQKKHSYKEFTTFIASCESHVKRMWSGNNLNGFISLVEAMLYEQNNRLLERMAEQNAQPQEQAQEQAQEQEKLFNGRNR